MSTAASRCAFISPRIAAAPLRGTGCPHGQAATSFGEGDRNPNIYGITVDSSDPKSPPPTSSAWEEVMHPWLRVATATKPFPRGRPLTVDPPFGDQQSNQSPSPRLSNLSSAN